MISRNVPWSASVSACFNASVATIRFLCVTTLSFGGPLSPSVETWDNSWMQQASPGMPITNSRPSGDVIWSHYCPYTNDHPNTQTGDHQGTKIKQYRHALHNKSIVLTINLTLCFPRLWESKGLTYLSCWWWVHRLRYPGWSWSRWSRRERPWGPRRAGGRQWQEGSAPGQCPSPPPTGCLPSGSHSCRGGEGKRSIAGGWGNTDDIKGLGGWRGGGGYDFDWSSSNTPPPMVQP